MGRYRKIDPRIWNDEKFARLSDDGKFTFLFVLTHPHMTALGAMRATIAGLGAELRWSSKRIERALGNIVDLGLLVVNAEAAFIGAPNFLRYNEPEGPNSVTKAWIAALDLIPECVEKQNLIVRCGRYLDGKPDAFKDAIGDAIRHAFPMASPIQDQDQDREQEQEQQQKEEAPKPAEQYLDLLGVTDDELNATLECYPGTARALLWYVTVWRRQRHGMVDIGQLARILDDLRREHSERTIREHFLRLCDITMPASQMSFHTLRTLRSNFATYGPTFAPAGQPKAARAARPETDWSKELSDVRVES